jgi:eukaryotic-like serine/threonine-protein kinase
MRHDHTADAAAPEERQTDAPAGAAARDPLDAFPTEAQVATAAARRKKRRRAIPAWLAVAGAVVVVGLALAWLFLAALGDTVRRGLGLSTPSAQGVLSVDTSPPGWDVLEGGRTLGTTPLRISLPPGPHRLVLRSAGATRTLDVVLLAGSQVFHHLDLPAVSATILSITTLPPGAAVAVDGVPRGVSPVNVPGLAPGEHTVSVTAGSRTVAERVTVAEARTTTLVVPVAQPAAAGDAVGFVTIAAPIELQVFDGDSLVGSSRNQRIMLMSGRRTLRLVNLALGFERTQGVTVDAGAVTKLAVPVPNGTLSVNAVPWAEVSLDGRVIGETPIANLSVAIGSHEVVLRNPKFPEQRRTVVITLTAPARIGVDLRK